LRPSGGLALSNQSVLVAQPLPEGTQTGDRLVVVAAFTFPLGAVMADVGGTQGALYIGTGIAGVFFGVSCLQTFFYTVHYTNDPWPIKTAVAVVFVADLMHQLMCSHSGEIIAWPIRVGWD
jgi:hypothetical protein